MVFFISQTSSTSCITIPIINDEEVEDDEDFTLSITSAGSVPHAVVEGPSVTTVTIIDDDSDGNDDKGKG